MTQRPDACHFGSAGLCEISVIRRSAVVQRGEVGAYLEQGLGGIDAGVGDQRGFVGIAVRKDEGAAGVTGLHVKL